MASLAGFAPLLDYRYWLNPYPVPLGPSLAAQILMFFMFYVVVGAVLYAVAHAVRKSEPLRADLMRRFAWPIVVTGILGLFFLFFSYEQSPFLGMRFWYVLVFAYLLVRLAIVAVYVVREYPVKRAAVEEQKRLAQYLPRSR